MSNTPFTDSHNHDAHTPGQLPIVLARLPRVGVEQSKRVNPAPVQTQAQTQAVPPPTPEGVPYVALRDQIEARTQLHIANTPAEEVAASATHFVDHKHATPVQDVESVHTLSMPAVEEARRQTASHRRNHTPQATSVAQSRTTTNGSGTLSGKMFQLHARLAPHAGLIVALALLASAGLLYWMIIGPTQTPPTLYETIGSGLQGGTVGTITSTMPEDYQPEFVKPERVQVRDAQPSDVVESPQLTNPAALGDQWVEVQLPTTESATDSIELTESQRTQQTQPLPPIVVAEQVVPSQKVTAQTDLPYPTTSNSGRLDFSKLGVVRSPSSSSDAQPVQPELARRPNSSTNR